MKSFLGPHFLLFCIFFNLQAPSQNNKPSFFEKLFNRNIRRIAPSNPITNPYFSGPDTNNPSRLEKNLFSKLSTLKRLLISSDDSHDSLSPEMLLKEFATQQNTFFDITIFGSLEGNAYLQRFYSTSFYKLDDLLHRYGLLPFADNLSFLPQNTFASPSVLNRFILDLTSQACYNSLLFQTDVSAVSLNLLRQFVKDFQNNLIHSFFKLDFNLTSGVLLLQITPLSPFLEITRKNLISSNRQTNRPTPTSLFIEPEDFEQEDDNSSPFQTISHSLTNTSSAHAQQNLSRQQFNRNYTSPVFDLSLPNAPTIRRSGSSDSD